ncbi:hypothetical protein [Dysgonomonas macrotermitis]|uniref:AhpC/TSA family protein n=1 Tax=Dysgonomonas macrotermitis TaxID=1346286 RepID=A0A1M4WKN6_9BACT|nr:hypothetical protein [Dysgonomonas macrotermitis]SHE81871.1 hypothetical protein SAMN05444362_102251 [Dysgonomonas macrotermitis]
MKTTYWILAVTLILVILNLILIKNIVSLREYNTEMNNELKKAKDWNQKLDIIRINKVYEEKSEDLQLPQLFLLDAASNFFFIDKKLPSQKHLVLYISESNCEDCIRHALDGLRNYTKDIGIQNIIILTNYVNQRHYQAFQRTLDLQVISYNVNGQKLNLPVEILHKPFFFILDTDLSCRQVFLPAKEIEDYTARYLRDISKQHWKKENQSDQPLQKQAS